MIRRREKERLVNKTNERMIAPQTGRVTEVEQCGRRREEEAV